MTHAPVIDPVDEIEAAIAQLDAAPTCPQRYARLKAKEHKYLGPVRWGEETPFGWRRRDYSYVAEVHRYYHRDTTGRGAAYAKAEDDARFWRDYRRLAQSYEMVALRRMTNAGFDVRLHPLLISCESG